MYPAQTSLIPVTVSVASFVERYGLKALMGNYPYWYLGIPAKYLLGPIVPVFSVFVHNIFPNVSLFSITMYLVLVSLIIGACGWGLLVKKISGLKLLGVMITILLILFPYRYLSSLALSEASLVISKNLLPFVFISFWSYLKRKNNKNALIVILTTSFLFLINTGVLSVLVVGFASLAVSSSYKKGKIKGIEEKIRKLALIIIFSLALVTFWYTPDYWLEIITNPSIGGVSGLRLILRLFDLFRSAIPLVLAIIVIYFSSKIKSRLSIFSLIWMLTFSLLTVYRFIGDPDFWQDWTSWFYEIEIGVVLLTSIVISRFYQRLRNKEVTFLKLRKTYLITAVIFITPFITSYYIYSILGGNILPKKNIPNGILSLKKLDQIVGDERVFLSGSTTFWANSLYSINQVRGGSDQVATHPYWDHAAYQLREGNDPKLARVWLEALGVSYVLVHTDKSFENYHDFRNLIKWPKAGELVWKESGDEIYKIKASSLSWVVDKEMLDDIKSPDSGIDLMSLEKYLSAKQRNLDYQWISQNEISIDVDGLKNNQGIIIALNYDKRWKSKDNIKISKDPLGQLLLTPKSIDDSFIVLTYR